MIFQDFENFLLTEECFDNHDVSVIDKDGLQHYLNINNEDYMAYFAVISLELGVWGNTIKVEQIEKWFDYNDRTAHAFYNQVNSGTFSIHTDPVDVIIECLDGRKYMEVEGKEIVLEPHDTLLIPANTEHRALNKEKALMISYGIHDTETLNGLREDDGDLQPRL